MKDYYQILGVSKTATQDEIRTAYRKLAMQYHPDRNSAPEAQAKFQEVNEANEVLGDPQKRAQYDHTGGQPPPGFEFHMDMHDMFDQIFRRNNGFGASFHNFTNKPSRNQDQMLQLQITLEEAFWGKQVPIQFTDSQGKQINLQVNIPPGTQRGTRIRYAGNGSRVHVNLPPGDLYVIIDIQPHALFVVDGAHLITTVSLSLWESLVGKTITIMGVDSKSISIDVPPLSTNDTVIKISGAGMPLRSDRKIRGDMFVKTSITMPEQLTPEQHTLIKQWCVG